MLISFYTNPNICILTSIPGAKIFPGMYTLNKKINSIIFDSTIKGQKVTDLIYDRISNRKPKDNMLVIYPDAMEPIPAGKNIAPFKTGAFRGKFDILPVVIKYKNATIDPTLHWYKGEHPAMCFSKDFMKPQLLIQASSSDHNTWTAFGRESQAQEWCPALCSIRT